MTTRSPVSPTGKTRLSLCIILAMIDRPSWRQFGFGFLIVMAWFFIVPALSGPAQAASFDCSKAELPLDKLICATPELSTKDDEMGAKYRAALAILSPEGQGILKEGQRKWLKFVRAHCTARIGQPADKDGGDAVECLRHEYDDRLRQLIASAQRIGPYTFSEVDDFSLTPSSPDDRQGYRSGFIYRIISYPRIDAPVTPATKKWNEQAVSWVNHIKETAFKPVAIRSAMFLP